MTDDVTDRIREYWDRDAATYDRSASHATSDPVDAAVWRAVLRRSLPDPPASVLDVGAGTGALSMLASELGHRVTGLDVSDAMLERARAKAVERGIEVDFRLGPAVGPPPGPFDAVFARHVAWTLPDPVAAFRSWREVVAPGGRIVLFEGSWASDHPADRVRGAVAALVRRAVGADGHHHAGYPDDLLAALPLAGHTTPAPLIRAVREAGWTGVRVTRLRDVEWAARSHDPWPIGWLEHRVRYVVVADRP